MGLKIDNLLPSNSITGRQNQSGKEPTADVVPEGNTDTYTSAADRVTLTNSAHHMASVINSAKDLSEASVERIEKLRSSINDGSYKMNSEVIAQKIMHFESSI